MSWDWNMDMARNVLPTYAGPEYGRGIDLGSGQDLRRAGTAVMGIAGSLATLGMISDEQTQLLSKINAVAQVTIGTMMLAQAYRAAVASRATIESAILAGEMALMAALQNWPAIGVALTAGAISAAAVTQAAGMWRFPGGDLGNPLDRGRMARDAGSVI